MKAEIVYSLLKNVVNIRSLLLLLIIFFLPTQLGYHLWPSFSYVLGFRVDYLSPTFYFTDLLIWVFILSESLTYLRNRKTPIKNKAQLFIVTSDKKTPNNLLINHHTIFWSVFLLFILLNSIFSVSTPNTIVGYLKLFELLAFGYFLNLYFSKYTLPLVLSFIAGCSLQAVLSIAQFFHQGSLGGFLYYMGERTYDSLTPGIANASLDGLLILRPYGTLPHPNVLGGLLVIGLLFLVSFRKYMRLPLLTFFITLFSTALLLTLSRTAIVTAAVITPLLFLKKTISNKQMGILLAYGVLGALILFLSPLGQRFHFLLADESVTMRVYLLKEAYYLFTTHAFLGVGLHSFLPALSQADTFSRDIEYLQPVHSIYLLVLSELGIVGVSLLLWKVVSVFRTGHLEYSVLSISLIASILFIGLFDHYFLTLQQGQLVLIFCISYIVSQKKSPK